MPVDRILASSRFSKYGGPNWRCMECNGGYLRLVVASIQHRSTAESIRAQTHEAHEPDWDVVKSVAMAVCDNPSCREPATIAAEGTYLEDNDWESQTKEYTPYFTPKYFSPSPALIDVPQACPEDAHAEIRLAFVSSWGDPSAAANHLRTAIERLLDSLGVAKLSTLHHRIEALKSSDPGVSNALMAIKWLGNAGSHADHLTQDDVFDGLDILELTLHKLYVDHTRKIDELIAAVNAGKGPRKVERVWSDSA